MNQIKISEQYENAKVEGRDKFCPRQGTYLILLTYFGECYGKPALMAKANWKSNINDSYDEQFTVELQLESFKGVDEASKHNWKDREILVEHAEYNVQLRQFNVRWKLVEIKQMSLDDLNSLAQSNTNIFDQAIKSTDDVDLDDYDDYAEY